MIFGERACHCREQTLFDDDDSDTEGREAKRSIELKCTLLMTKRPAEHEASRDIVRGHAGGVVQPDRVWSPLMKLWFGFFPKYSDYQKRRPEDALWNMKSLRMDVREGGVTRRLTLSESLERLFELLFDKEEFARQAIGYIDEPLMAANANHPIRRALLYNDPTAMICNEVLLFLWYDVVRRGNDTAHNLFTEDIWGKLLRLPPEHCSGVLAGMLLNRCELMRADENDPLEARDHRRALEILCGFLAPGRCSDNTREFILLKLFKKVVRFNEDDPPAASAIGYVHHIVFPAWATLGFVGAVTPVVTDRYPPYVRFRAIPEMSDEVRAMPVPGCILRRVEMSLRPGVTAGLCKLGKFVPWDNAEDCTLLAVTGLITSKLPLAKKVFACPDTLGVGDSYWCRTASSLAVVVLRSYAAFCRTRVPVCEPPAGVATAMFAALVTFLETTPDIVHNDGKMAIALMQEMAYVSPTFRNLSETSDDAA
jgi:hypothetical protein